MVTGPPLESSRPPILIGGGERKTLRMMAQYADACHLFGSSVDAVAHNLDVLRGHCDALGRGPRQDRKDDHRAGEPDEGFSPFLKEMERYAALAVDLVEVAPMPPDPARFVTFFHREGPRPAQPDRLIRLL